MKKYLMILLLLSSCSTTKRLDYNSFLCYPMDEERVVCTVNLDIVEHKGKLVIPTDKVQR